MTSSYQTWTEWKISSNGFHIIHLLRAFWKRLFRKRSASKFYELLKRSSKQALLIIFLEVFVFFSGHFLTFQGKIIWRNSFLDELLVDLLKKGLLIDVLCQNISLFFLKAFSKSTPALLYWNVLQSFSNFDNSSRWIVLEKAIQRCSLLLAVPGPREVTYNFSKIHDK